MSHLAHDEFEEMADEYDLSDVDNDMNDEYNGARVIGSDSDEEVQSVIYFYIFFCLVVVPTFLLFCLTALV
jgi:hypothetical protein